MRLSCFVAAVLLPIGLVSAAEPEPPSETAGLSAEEIKEGFIPIFNGKNLDGWVGVAGSTDSYYVEDGVLICKEEGREHIFTEKEYADFVLRLQIKLAPDGNNGVGIRTQISRQPHLYGMEVQVLDDQDARYHDPSHPKYLKLKPYQYHGSIYGVVPAKRGFLKPVGQWNDEEIVCKGRRVRVTLNDTVIVDADLDEITYPTMDGKDHPGLKYKKGHIGLHAHLGGLVYFRNIRIKEL